VGFTARPEDYRFTRYASDVAKIIQAPVFHVNGNDPEAAVQAARLAAAFRRQFKVDVIINLVCYRRHGHNETDDPTFTQPVMYQIINQLPPVRDIYAQRLIESGVTTAEEIQRRIAEWRELFEDALNYARDFMPRQQVFALGGVWKGFSWASSDWGARTAVARDRSARRRGAPHPARFDAHPGCAALRRSREMVRSGTGIDWGGAGDARWAVTPRARTCGSPAKTPRHVQPSPRRAVRSHHGGALGAAAEPRR
jgi:2-oxoglutarate dehydrogenase E1 component